MQSTTLNGLLVLRNIALRPIIMARQFSLFLLLYVILLLAHLDYLPRRILSASLASTRYFLRPFLGWVLQTRLFPSDPSRRKADFDAYLVLHIETTLGPPETTIGYPNEIIVSTAYTPVPQGLAEKHLRIVGVVRCASTLGGQAKRRNRVKIESD